MTTLPLQNFPLRIGARHVLLAGGITGVIAMSRVLKAMRADYIFICAGRIRTSMA